MARKTIHNIVSDRQIGINASRCVCEREKAIVSFIKQSLVRKRVIPAQEHRSKVGLTCFCSSSSSNPPSAVCPWSQSPLLSHDTTSAGFQGGPESWACSWGDAVSHPLHRSRQEKHSPSCIT